MLTRFMYTQAMSAPGTWSYKPESIASAKRASVLFDEIIFERQLSTVGEDGFSRPVGASEAAALRARGVSVAEWSETADFFTDDPQAPPLGGGTYNGLYVILPRLGCDWVRDIVVDPTTLRDPVGSEHEDPWERQLRARAASFETTVYDGCRRPSVLGEPALAIFVPDLAKVPWEAIAEFRDHPGSREARHRLRDFDAKAQLGTIELGQAGEFERRVGSEITRCLLAAWAETRPNLGIELTMEAIKTGIGFVPFAGPAAATAMSVTSDAAKTYRHDRSWLSALCLLARA